jgi:hypothetical protein
MPTYVLETVHSGAETVSNVLAGLPVAQVGTSGEVICAYISGDGTSSASVRATGRGGSEVSIIPDGSNAIVATELKASDHFIYRASGLQPGSAILATLTASSASTSVLCVRTY